MKNNVHIFIAIALLSTTSMPVAFAQDIVVKRSTSDVGAMIRNDDRYVHQTDPLIDFGGEDDSAMLAVQDGPNIFETAGFHANGDNAIIWSSGDVANVPSAPPQALLYIIDEDFWDGDGDPFDDGGLIAYLDDAGMWQVSAAAQKSNIVRLTGAVAKVQSLNGYSYEFAPNAEEQKKNAEAQRATGVLAHELQEVLPEAVNTNAHGEMWVNYSQITPLLIEAIKEQQAAIAELQQRLDGR